MCNAIMGIKLTKMKPTGLGMRVRAARKAKGMTQVQLARAAGIDQSTVSKIERGAQASTTDIVSIASALGVDSAFLDKGVTTSQAAPPSDTIRGIQAAGEEDLMLMQYADPRCPHGPHYGMRDMPQLETIAMARAILAGLGIPEEAAIGFEATGNAMASTICHGDRGVIDTRHRDPVSDPARIFAIAHGGSILLRRIVGHATGRLTISSDNRDKSLYPDEEIPASERDGIRVIGRVRYSGGEK